MLAALLLAGFGLSRLTGHSIASTAVARPATTPSPPAAASATFELFLSAAAKSLSLEAGGAPFVLQDPRGPIIGTLEISEENPAIFLKVEWADISPNHRFAKLRIDRPGKPTLAHVFSAPGDIDDIWEP